MKSHLFCLSVVCLLACKAPQPAVVTPTPGGGSENFFAHRWEVTEIRGQAVAPSGSARDAHLLFYPGQVSRVSGSTGCNKLNGTFELLGEGRIRFSPLATTKMACPDGANEALLLDALGKVNNYYFADSNLMLLNAKMLLVKLKATAAAPPDGQ